MGTASEVSDANSVHVTGVLTSVPTQFDNQSSVIRRKSVSFSNSVDQNVAPQVVVVEMTGCVTVTQQSAVVPHILCREVLPVVVAEKVPVDGLVACHVTDVNAVVIKVTSRDQFKLGKVYEHLGTTNVTSVSDSKV
jgi:hypothetical protein